MGPWIIPVNRDDMGPYGPYHPSLSPCLSLGIALMAVLRIVAVAALLSPVLCFNMEVSMTSSLTFDAEAAKNRPVSKVITLLKDWVR